MSKYARIIDIEKLLYRKGFCIGKTPDELYEALADLPTIDIVRCKECKYADKCSQNVAMQDTYQMYEKIDYCSCGERIDNE